MTIWKYELDITDRRIIEVPQGARPLSVQFQHGKLCLWCLVDPNAKKRTLGVAVVGTGHPFHSAGWNYVGTVQQALGPLVWHVFTESA